LIDLFVLFRPVAFALCLFVINKVLQQQIVVVFFGRESPAGEYWTILYMGAIKFISKVLPAA
jgi:hypothetical protein